MLAYTKPQKRRKNAIEDRTRYAPYILGHFWTLHSALSFLFPIHSSIAGSTFAQILVLDLLPPLHDREHSDHGVHGPNPLSSLERGFAAIRKDI